MLVNHHFYTISTDERDKAINRLCFRDEGVACYVHDGPQTVAVAATLQTAELYRLYNPSNGDHFYTTDAAERDNAVSQAGYQHELVAGYLFDSQASSTVPLYRLYNPSNGDHFYTTDAAERDNAVSQAGYRHELVAGYLFDSQASGTVPLYRLYNPSNGDHFYTTDAAERDNAVSQAGYQHELVAGYIYETPQLIRDSVITPVTTELYRLFNPQTGDHFYTIDGVERNNAISQLGFRDEGVACFVFPDQRSDTVPLHRLYHPALVDHFYTTSTQERDRAATGGWQTEIVACYVFPQHVPGTTPLYRMFMPELTKIESFTADRDYINPNQKVALSWSVQVHFPTFEIRLRGVDDRGHVVLDVSNLRSGASLDVNPTRSTTYRLTATDCRGSISAERFVTVYKAPPPRSGIAKILIHNCTDTRHTISIWTNDLTAGTGWKRQGDLAPQWDTSGSCPAAGAQPFSIQLQSGHQYEIVAVDGTSCGQDDPTILSCRKWVAQVVAGASGAATEIVT
jgi:hypothetical protein